MTLSEMSKKPTAKQQRFVEEYLVDLNATRAAIRAGYSKKTADRIGPKLVVESCVSEAIREAIEKRSSRTEITADRVLQELGFIAFSNMKDYVEFGPPGVTLEELSEMTDDQSRAISQVSHNFNAEGGGSVNFKLHDKLKALDLIGKHLGMFKEKVEHSGELKVESAKPDYSNLTTGELEQLQGLLGKSGKKNDKAGANV